MATTLQPLYLNGQNETLGFNDTWEWGYRIVGDLSAVVGDIVQEETWPRGEATPPTLISPDMIGDDQEQWWTQPFTRGAGLYTKTVRIFAPTEQVAYFTCMVLGVTLADVKEYLGDTSWDDAEILNALRAETEAQQRRVRYPVGPLPHDLREALQRRVARNLAMRAVPLGVQMDETGGTRLGSTDPEVRRLEQPHRKRVVA